MNQKKILLPENNIKERATRTRKYKTDSSVQKTRSHRNNTRTIPSAIDLRQRNEAIGLIFVGLSAFSLSLTHYLSSSKVSGLVNTLMIYFGMGVYLAPGLLGLWGIQRFLERPFSNLRWRLAGASGVMFFGLGLFDLEGGKIGAYTMHTFSNIFGSIPSKILFTFLILSSFIFALDILYKDLLAMSLVIASMLTRLFIFAWEITINLLSMFIGAVKTTLNLFIAIYGRIRQVFTEQKIDPTSQLGKLLTFRPHIAEESRKEMREDIKEKEIGREETTLADHEETQELTTDVVIVEKTIEEATVIPIMQSWRENTVSDEELQAPKSEVAFQAFQVTQIATQSVFFDTNMSNVTPLPYSKIEELTKDEDEDEDEFRILVDLEEDEEIVENIAISSGSFTKANDKATHEADSPDEPVYLEDNRIDHEIKTGEFTQQNTQENETEKKVKLPPIELLKIPPPRDNSANQSDLSERSAFLLKTLEEFGIKATITAIVEGPAVSRFELKPAPGVKVSRITSLTDDIALALAAPSIRIEAPIPGKPALGIEIPNTNPTPVYFYDLLKNDKFGKSTVPLELALGVTINGKPVFADLSEMPHLLIAGSTGSGKSVCVNTIIASILFQARADQVKFVMIDPKMVELSSYNGIPHLIAPVVTDPAKASDALKWAVEEMTRRYELLAGCGCKKITTYNEELERLREDIDPDLEPLPFIVIVIDELADLMMTASAEVEGSICRLAQMARAVGMHLIIATQRPSVNVLTGLIKANLPTRIAFSVTSAIDSRTILDSKGAERLLGKGDMLFIPKGRNKPLRLQGAFVSDRELMDLIEFVKKQGQPEYMDIAPLQSDDDDELNDEEEHGNSDSPLVSQIIKYLETQEKTSTSMLQRKFRIGYNRAARIMDQLEEKGLVTPMDGANKRRVLIGRSGVQV